MNARATVQFCHLPAARRTGRDQNVTGIHRFHGRQQAAVGYRFRPAMPQQPASKSTTVAEGIRESRATVAPSSPMDF